MTYYPRDSVAEKRVQLILRTVIRDSRETFREKQGSQAAFYLHHMTDKNCSVLASFFFSDNGAYHLLSETTGATNDRSCPTLFYTRSQDLGRPFAHCTLAKRNGLGTRLLG